MVGQKNWYSLSSLIKYMQYMYIFTIIIAIYQACCSYWLCYTSNYHVYLHYADHHTHTTYFKLHMYDGTRNCTSNYVVY